MITAVFTENNDYAQVYGVWQWDYGQELRIQGLNLPAAVEIHFALQETGGEAVTRVGVTQDGITTVPIPDSMLEGAGNSKDYQIYAWVYLADQVSGETIKRIKIQVRARPMPEAFEAPEDGEIFRQAIEAVNEAAKRAEDAGKEAVSSAGEAREAATQAGKHLETVQGLADQAEINADTVAQDKQAVAGMLSQVQQAASEAALSAEAAKLSETAAGQAQTGAEAAEDGARQYAADTEADRQEVASARQAVQQMREDVAADKTEVEQTTAGFVDTAGKAVSDVNAAGKAQVDAIKTAGQGASNAVETAKTTAVQAVTAEGDKQVQRVQEAAAGVEADREQINQNKADIAGLAEGITDLAPGIKITATGTDITIKDAAEGRAFKGLRVFGRTDQKGTPSPETPQEMETAGESGSIEVLVAGSNLLKPNNYNVFCESPLEANTVVTLMTNGKASNGGNIKFIGTDDSNVWFSIDKGQTKVCKSIGSKPVKGFYDLLTQTSGLEYMLAVGDVKTYESYRTSQSLTLSAPNGLPGIPVSSGGNYTDAKGQQWVCDEIDLEREKYIERRWQKVFDGSEDWRIYSSSRFKGYMIDGILPFSDSRRAGFCNMFTVSENTEIIESIWLGVGNSILYTVSNRFYDESLEDKGLANWKAFLAENPMKVMTYLDTPIERGLTPEEIAAYKALRTYSPTTVVSNDAGCHMETTYTADTKTYIDNKFAALNKTILDAVGGT
ncbi:hypothetical protein [Enterocloster alcoholdehydrogenati]|uniref:hypothetical protein n=1 Tax=Enterocloster alcoholdehydrogenati TaxID=2547410 RepID=UPI001594A074|nr:hypothetical protein [Enterocloster alcoholdehydrogenati]